MAIEINENIGTPTGVVSLYELLQFYADFFMETFAFLNAIERMAVDCPEGQMVNDEGAIAVYAKINLLSGMSSRYGFESVVSQCKRIVQTLERKGMKVEPSDMAQMLRELRQRCQDEIGSRFFLSLDPPQARMYQNPEDGWEEVKSRFWEVRKNIEETSKCFSLERYAASVFHVLLVAEFGVIQVAELLQIKAGHPGWGQVKPLQALIVDPYPKRSPLAQKHSKLLEAVVPLLHQVKESFRHKISHVESFLVWQETDFSEHTAEEIIKATRGFMRKLCSDLPRQVKP